MNLFRHTLPIQPILVVRFYRAAAGREPVRDWQMVELPESLIWPNPVRD